MDVIGLIERIYYRFRSRGDVIERLRPSFPPGIELRTLDLGGGEGRVSRLLAERSPGVFVVADIDLEALRAVPRNGRLRPILVGATGRLPFREGTFDRVLLIDVIHEVRDARARLLPEAARLLAPGGELIAVDFDGRSRLATLFGWIARLTGRRCRFFTSPDELRRALERAGLDAEVASIDGLRILARARVRPATRPSSVEGARASRAFP